MKMRFFGGFGPLLLSEKCRYWLDIPVSTAHDICKCSRKISGSFDNNYYGPVVSGAWVTPILSSDDSTEKLTFQPSLTHCAQNNEATNMKLA